MTQNDEKIGFERPTTPIGQYYLLDKMAQGGMAEIYKGLAYDLHGIKRTVVIKKILPSIAADPEFVNMLINEAKIAVMLSHGNIAQIYDLGKIDEDYFMVMEYVNGRSLAQIHKRSLKKGNLVPIEYVCYFIAEVANGLNYMHRKTDDQGRNLGIIHRDISPQNVIVSYSGIVKIIDFGIAKAAIQMNITESGVLKGKFAYMAPEQARGDEIDHRADIFSLGVILYELLTGRRLFKGKDKKETLQNVRKALVAPPSSLRADLPADLDKIVLKALSKDPKKRYLWASEFNNDLTRFIYRNYPNFKHSTVVDYIRDLFKDEIAEVEDVDEDAKTPFLIIDHTQSAILSENEEDTGIIRIPPQLQEFMLDDEPTPVPEKKEQSLIVPEEKKLIQKQKVKKVRKKGWLRKIVKRVLIKSSIVCAVGLIVYFLGFVFSWWHAPWFLQGVFPKNYIKLYIEPKDAQVIFGTILLEGNPPFKIKNIQPDTSFDLIVEKDGYNPFYKNVKLLENEKIKMKIALQPEPPHYAELTLTSTPKGAAIYLNDKDTNLRTPATLPPLTPNEYHTLGLYLDGYKFWSRDLRLKQDQQKTMQINLNVDFGSFKIMSNPTGAKVYLDDKYMGNTPFIKTKMQPGEIVNIQIEKEGYLPHAQKIKIKPGKLESLGITLNKEKQIKKTIPRFLKEHKK